MRTHKFPQVVAALSTMLLSACAAELADPAKPAAEAAKAPLLQPPVLNPFTPESLEIDQLGGLGTPEDANLFVGTDPADATPSAQKPGSGATWLDWNDLGLTPASRSNHQLLDLDDPATGKDASAFPLSNECVGAAQVLSKMDLTYVAASNNSEYAYLAVQRSDNNGDAAYYWLFTHLPPRLNANEAPCKSGQSRLLYDLSPGDVLIGGHFHPGSTALLRVWKANAASTGVPAVEAVDFTKPRWIENVNGVSAVAVNTTATAPGSFGSAGVGKTALPNGQLGHELFAEAAVPMSVFGNGSACGASLYGSVITRSSGSGGTSPDLKDLAGPALFNLSPVSPSPTLTLRCGAEIGFAANVAGYASNDPQLTCAWSFFKDGATTPAATSSSCDGTLAGLAPGTYTARVTVTGPSGCAITTAPSGSATVYAPIAVTPSLAGTCARTFTYDATVSGGSDPAGGSFAWTFSGGGTTTPSTSTTRSGSVAVGAAEQQYSASVTYTDPRGGLNCTATGAADVTVTDAGCFGLNLSKAVSATAASPGASLTYTLSWASTGSASLTQVILTDPLPPQTSFLSASGGGTYDAGTNSVTWNLGTVPSGATGSVTLTVQLAAVFPAGITTLVNVATIDSDQTDPQSAQAETIVTAFPQITLSKAVDKTAAAPGDLLTYTLTYANVGNANASGVVISDAVPAHTSFVSASPSCVYSGGLVSCAIGALAAGAAGSVSFIVQLDAVFPAGTTQIDNTGVIVSDQTPEAPSNTVSTLVNAAPQLNLSKQAAIATTALTITNSASLTSTEGAGASASATSENLIAKSTITYTLTFSNTGNAAASGVALADALPANTAFVSASDGGTYDAGTNTVSWSIGTLGAGASASRTLVLDVIP